jgi:hypothetical protein
MVGVVARNLLARGQLEPPLVSGRLWPALPSARAGISVEQGHCSRTKVRVPLARSGLPGPPVRYDHVHHCILNGRVFVRARAVSDGRGFSATVAVRIGRSREPIAFARIARDGTGAVYATSRCELRS